MIKTQPWQTEIRCSEKALALFMKALLELRGHFTSALVFGFNKQLSGKDSAQIMVQLPIDTEAEFELRTGLKLRPVTRVQVGMNTADPYLYQGSFILERFPSYMKIKDKQAWRVDIKALCKKTFTRVFLVYAGTKEKAEKQGLSLFHIETGVPIGPNSPYKIEVEVNEFK